MIHLRHGGAVYCVEVEFWIVIQSMIRSKNWFPVNDAKPI
jgi:hypothetical protein